MLSSTITNRGQTTLPKRVREALNLKAGQKLVYEIHENKITITPHPGFMASFGSLKPDHTAPLPSWKEVRKQTREDWADHASQEGKPS